MKLKQRPEDFEVEELTDVVPGERGPFAFYRLEKCGWTTLDAVEAIRRRWQLERARVSCGGLKDRHARTRQYLTIFHGPRRRLTHDAIALEYLGQVETPYVSEGIRGNRFRIVLRALTPADVAAAVAAVEPIRRDGVPNYFDDQRFGSVTTTSGGAPTFMARLLVQGQFEEAVRHALTAPYEHDRAAARRVKALLRDGWGDWPALTTRLPPGDARRVVDYLVHRPGDFRGAVVRLRADLRTLYLAAFQSHLWNRILARWIETHVPMDERTTISLRLGGAPVPLTLDEPLRNEVAVLNLPLPSARLRLEPADPRLALTQQVLAEEEGLELKQLQVKGVRELFFSKGERAAWCHPVDLTCDVGDDDLNLGQKKLLLRFDLPRGSYATLIVKRIQQAHASTSPS